MVTPNQDRILVKTISLLRKNSYETVTITQKLRFHFFNKNIIENPLKAAIDLQARPCPGGFWSKKNCQI